jgi:glycosyltransferase involved in cell wall biosynthesis
MKVAVVTPYYREPLDTLRRCHESVLAQTHAATHFMVADGHARSEVGDWGVEHLILPRAHGDYGNTPRCFGAISALNLGFDAFAFLDADNWYTPDHIESLVAACEATGAPIAFASRHVVLPSGQEVAVGSDGALAGHVDTSCFFITAQAAFLLPVWAMMDPSLSPIGDRVLLSVLQQRGLLAVETRRKTVFYESTWAVHYESAGLTPPHDATRMANQAVGKGFSEERSTARLGFRLGIRVANP